jgi:hypothetical protein
MHTGISVHPIPVYIQGSSKSPYAYGDQDQSLYAYGDCILIPVCIRELHDMQTGPRKSPYAYGDQDVIPVCIHGSHAM